MKTKFSWRAWQWTGADENLFDLDPEAAQIFALFVSAAQRA